jgi:hypothetical protein
MEARRRVKFTIHAELAAPVEKVMVGPCALEDRRGARGVVEREEDGLLRSGVVEML